MPRYASDFGNIRINGTGRLYANDVGAAGPGEEIGEIDTLTDNISSTYENVTTNRKAGKAIIGSYLTEKTATLNFGAKEMTNTVLQMAYQAAAATSAAQTAGNLVGQEVTFTAIGKFVDLGKLNCFATLVVLSGITGVFDLGETVTGGTSSASGKVAWIGEGYVELVNVSGTFAAGETVTGGTSAATATVYSAEKVEDMVVTDNATTPTKRYALGTDYVVDAENGFIAKASGSTIPGLTAFVSCGHDSATIETMHGLSDTQIQKKLTFVSDKNDKGPRFRIT
jgi:hypothetical protein